MESNGLSNGNTNGISNGFHSIPAASNRVIIHNAMNGIGGSSIPMYSFSSTNGFNGQLVNGATNGTTTSNGGIANASTMPTAHAKAAVATPSPSTANGTDSRPVKRPDVKAIGAEVVSYLMSFNVQTSDIEKEFAEKALESLHKKIKDRPRDLEAFIRCVETKGEVTGGCVTVTRTLDGRLQVAGQKGFPHVIYTKIFRYENVHKNELKSIPKCRFAFENKEQNEDIQSDAQVCVNPYHYEKLPPPPSGATLFDPTTGRLRVNGVLVGEDGMSIPVSPSDPKTKTRHERSVWSVDKDVITLDDDEVVERGVGQGHSKVGVESKMEAVPSSSISFSTEGPTQLLSLNTRPVAYNMDEFPASSVYSSAEGTSRLISSSPSSSTSVDPQLMSPYFVPPPTGSNGVVHNNVTAETVEADEEERIRKREEAAAVAKKFALEQQKLQDESVKQHLENCAKLTALEVSLTQIVEMLDKVAMSKRVSPTEYILCCQHYVGMLTETAELASLNAYQRRLVDAAVNKARDKVGGVSITKEQLRATRWDLSRILRNHTMTIPERRELREKRKNEQRVDDFAPGWEVELDKAETDEIFTKEQIERAEEARRRIIRGKNSIPSDLMEFEEQNNGEARKRKRAESEGEADGEDSLHSALKNLSIADNITDLIESSNQYLRTFREAISGPATMEQEDPDDHPSSGVEDNSEPTENEAERPPSKKKTDDAKKKTAFLDKDDQYIPGVSREIVDAAVLLNRAQEKKGEGLNEIDEHAPQFDNPDPGISRIADIEPPPAISKPFGYNWATVNYCELDQHVGQQKQVSPVTYFIDGGFDSGDKQRYCLGSALHPVMQFHKEVRRVKPMIGAGIRLSLKEDGSVWIRVLSRFPIFVSSTLLDVEAGMTSEDSAHKLYPGQAAKIFDLLRVRRAIVTVQADQSAARKAKQGGEKGDKQVSRPDLGAMYRHAVVKISFVEGWGPEYDCDSIQETPCWLEIIMNRACEFIDHVTSMRETYSAASDDEA